MTRARVSHAGLRRAAPAAAVATAFIAMALLYAAGARGAYDGMIAAWGVEPFAFPFVDTDMILSALRCRRSGVDVFADNPCDALGRLYDYSPVWLLGAALPVTTGWILPVGLTVDGAFIACLLLLPAGRGWGQAAAIVAVALSTPVAFALERGNCDLVIFTLAACAAWLTCRSQGLRLAGYGLAYLAGLLKYYPMLLMALATRERPIAFAAVAAAAFAVLAAFIALDGDELMRALALIPTGSAFGDMFGARQLPLGIATMLRLGPRGEMALRLGVPAVFVAAGVVIGVGGAVRDDLASLSEAERSFLLAGAMLLLGCFMTAQNIGYRAIHLLLVMPGVTALWHERRRGIYGISVCVLVVLAWAEGWRSWLAAWFGATSHPEPDAVGLMAWALREACWWWTITLLVAMAVGLLLRSDVVRSFRRWGVALP